MRGHRLVVDVVKAVGWLMVCLLQPTQLMDPSIEGPYRVFCLVVAGILVFQRTFPRAVVIALALAMVAYVVTFDVVMLVCVVGTLAAAYTAHAYLTPRDRLLATFAMLAGTAWAVLDFSRPLKTGLDGKLLPLVLGGWLLVGFVSLLGTLARKRREELDQLAERARLLVQQQAQELQVATLAERARIAREMHDIVAHSLGVIIVQADGGRYGGPEASQQTLGTISSVARSSLAEMRQLLSVLRSDDEARGVAPAPDLDALPGLIDEYRRAGLDVHLTLRGEKSDLPPALALTVHRTVQEALTNVLKHAGPTTARVELDWEPTEVIVTVTNPLATGPVAAPPPGGHGLVGMRERVQLHGGLLEAGEVGSVWRIRATIPTATRGDA